MAKLSSYSVDQAAKRMGVSPGRVRQLLKNGALTVASESPLRIAAKQVDARRADSLAKFDDVQDLSGGATEPSGNLWRERAERAEDWLRSAAASRELIDDGIERIRRGERVLLDALLAGVPAAPQ
jgi:transcriptional regulator with XRE-family HTH domain